MHMRQPFLSLFIVYKLYTVLEPTNSTLNIHEEENNEEQEEGTNYTE